MNINKYICTGRLTKDPELRSLPSGSSVCELRLAVEAVVESARDPARLRLVRGEQAAAELLVGP